MSFDTFKSNMKRFMDAPELVDSSDTFAENLTNEYDSLVKRGGDSINTISVKQGNTELMYNILKNKLKEYSNSDSDNFIGDIGDAFKSYWLNAELNSYPLPITTTPPAYSNIKTEKTYITNSGEWKENTKTTPTDDVENFLDLLISNIKLHFTTIEGIIQTISLYPPTGNPGPGIVEWRGYTVN